MMIDGDVCQSSRKDVACNSPYARLSFTLTDSTSLTGKVWLVQLSTMAIDPLKPINYPTYYAKSVNLRSSPVETRGLPPSCRHDQEHIFTVSVYGAHRYMWRIFGNCVRHSYRFPLYMVLNDLYALSYQVRAIPHGMSRASLCPEGEIRAVIDKTPIGSERPVLLPICCAPPLFEQVFQC